MIAFSKDLKECAPLICGDLYVDTDLSKLSLYDCSGTCSVVAVYVDGAIETIRVTSFCHKCFCFLKVVLVSCNFVCPTRDHGVDVGVSRCTATLYDCVDEYLLVDSHVDSLTNTYIREFLFGCVHTHVLDGCGRLGKKKNIRVCLYVYAVDSVYVPNDINFACLESDCTSGTLRDNTYFDGSSDRSLFPVVLVTN